MIRKLLAILFLTCIWTCTYSQLRGIKDQLQKNNGDQHIGNIYAFIVGISNYKHIRPLNYADKDAELFAGFLQTTAGGKVRPENMILLTNENAKSGDFISGFQKIIKKPKAGDRFYFYFAGHGDGDKRKNKYYLLLNDIQPAGDANSYSYNNSAVNIADVKDDLGVLVRDSVEVIMIVDACRTNELPGGYTSQVLKDNVLEARVGEIMMSATGQGQVSIESPTVGNGHGLFTYTLVDGLMGEADKGANGNKDGLVSLTELQDWVPGKVRITAERDFKTKQIPYFCCGDKTESSISIVDSSLYQQWQYAKKNDNNLVDLFMESRPFTGRSDKQLIDSLAILLYGNFSDAIKKGILIGDSSANFFYEKLHSLYVNDDITRDAALMLFAELINSTQQKINQYLEGKDEYNIWSEFLRAKEKDSEADFVNNSAKRQLRISQLNWAAAAEMFEVALKLLPGYNSNENKRLLTQSYFFQARSFIGASKNSEKRKSLYYAHAAYNLDSSTASITHILAMALLDNELYDSALYFERKAIQLAPQWPQLQLGMGYIFSDMGIQKHDSAIFYFNRAIKLNPNILSSYIGKIPVFASRKQKDSVSSIVFEIKNRFKQASMEKKSWPSFLQRLGRIYLDLEMYDSALLYYNNSLKLNREQDYIYNSIGNTFYDWGKYDSAIIYYKTSFCKHGGNEDDCYNLGLAFSKLKFYDSSLYYLKKVIASNPESEAAYHKLGHVFYDLKKYDSALYYFNAIVSLGNKYEYALYDIGNIWEELKATDSAMYYYKRAISVNGKYANAYNGIGNLLYNNEKYDSALLYYKYSFALDPQFEAALSNIGRTFFDMEEFDSAITYYQTAIDLNLVNKEVFCNMGNAHLRNGEYDSAYRYFHLSLERDKNYEWAYAGLGYMYLKQRKFDSAILNYKRSIQLNSKFKGAYFSLGIAYQGYKLFDSAIYYFKQTLFDSSWYHSSCIRLTWCYALGMNYDSSKEYMNRSFNFVNDDSIKFGSLRGYFSKENLINSYHYEDTGQHNENPVIYFDLACVMSLKKELWNVEYYLEQAIRNGFNDIARIKNTPDLLFYRNSDRFEKMMNHFFKDEWKK